jgi:Fur family zinc uptake transcriptional regulator
MCGLAGKAHAVTSHANNPAPTQDRARKLEALGRVPREVYDLLAASPTPLKAYELLWRLQEQRGRRAPPSTIYRAVAVLMEAGLVHKIESLNAFVICTIEPDHHPVFLICEQCHRATEIDALAWRQEVVTHVQRAHFRAQHLNFVVRGVCSECQKQE